MTLENDALCGLSEKALHDEMTDFLSARGHKKFRIKQLIHWLYHGFAEDFQGMGNLPAALREALAQSYRLHALTLDRSVASRDGARKFLFLTADGLPVESVLLPVPDGATYCLSVSSGCPLACAFCATGTFFNRHLDAGEMVDQYLRLRGMTGDDPHFSGIVFMGMGEPSLNWPAVSATLAIFRDLAGIGARRVTVSTVGDPGMIRALGEAFPQVKLAVSLHAATDELRRWIVPAARKTSLAELMAACRQHGTATAGKRITFEYVLLAGVNDRLQDAQALSDLLAGMPAAVNLIPFNPFPGTLFSRPDDEAVARFHGAVQERFRGEVTVRKSLGSDASAACGQLGAGISPSGSAGG